ncbi:DUF488 domain-containing protein [Adhaeribacter sp. BT258]|uniref:DUF488 domain-containing protein n=1 Tax=Adhaeribacter terrigena TaxID=2793070 RepID=A0ABS1C0J9_9BACT|nr:DUF488 domain-containing protein [Adhaeribacter terrigena]MBK0402696.1 DUF488 domain-containing protein [Adhaeribacter terrigena]
MPKEVKEQFADTGTIWTIGHSTRSQEEFVEALLAFQIDVLVDVRRFPGSKKYPHFNVEALERYLPEAGIEYLPCTELGGRRKPKPDSKNTVWNSDSFRGYADYSETEKFKNALAVLGDLAVKKRVAYMCSEAVWWRCHRAIISDLLKEGGWKVLHIMNPGTVKEHPFTTAYREIHSLKT